MDSYEWVLVVLGALVVLAIIALLVEDARWYRLWRRDRRLGYVRVDEPPAVQPDRCGPWT